MHPPGLLDRLLSLCVGLSLAGSDLPDQVVDLLEWESWYLVGALRGEGGGGVETRREHGTG